MYVTRIGHTGSIFIRNNITVRWNYDNYCRCSQPKKKTLNHPMIFQINKMNLTSIKEYLTDKKVSVF